MMRVFVIISLALLVSVSLQAEGSSAGTGPSSQGGTSKESVAAGQRAQSPKEFIESRLGGKVVKVEKDPSDLRRAVLLVERKGSVSQHVLEVSLNPERELQDVRIVTPSGKPPGIPPVIVVPLSVVSKCWSHCKDECGQGTECRAGCLFDCMAD